MANGLEEAVEGPFELGPFACLEADLYCVEAGVCQHRYQGYEAGIGLTGGPLFRL